MLQYLSALHQDKDEKDIKFSGLMGSSFKLARHFNMSPTVSIYILESTSLTTLPP